MTELNANQRFLLAYATKKANTSKYGGRPSGDFTIKDASQKAIFTTLVRCGFGRLASEKNWELFVPDDKCLEFLRKYKPDTPEHQVRLWDLKAPQLRTLAKFINEHLGDKYEAKLENWSYTPPGKIPGTRLSHPGKRREGKRLVVWPKRYQDRDRYPLLTVVGPDPDDYNERAVNWLMETMGIKGLL